MLYCMFEVNIHVEIYTIIYHVLFFHLISQLHEDLQP